MASNRWDRGQPHIGAWSLEPVGAYPWKPTVDTSLLIFSTSNICKFLLLGLAVKAE